MSGEKNNDYYEIKDTQSQQSIINSDKMSAVSSSQFERLDYAELDWNNFKSEVSYGFTLGLNSTQQGSQNGIK